MFQYLNYENSILSLINSIEKYYGIKNDYSTLKIADTILENRYRNVVVMVFDAMGSRNLQEMLPKSSFLRKHMEHEIAQYFLLQLLRQQLL
jgi:hypothetical protein